MLFYNGTKSLRMGLDPFLRAFRFVPELSRIRRPAVQTRSRNAVDLVRQEEFGVLFDNVAQALVLLVLKMGPNSLF